MVAAVRRGASQRAVARRFKVGLRTVQRWVKRAEGRRLDRVDWSDQPRGPHRPANRTEKDVEDLVIQTRHQLRQQSDLGEYGAVAVHRTLVEGGSAEVPSVRTINRIFERRGLLDHRRQQRRKAPSKGWYLPEVAQQRCELDPFDLVEGLKIKDGPLVEVLNGVSLHGGLVGSWPQEATIKAKAIVPALIEHWQAHRLPTYAQFDNGTVFQGPHQHPHVISRVMRLCLSLGVVPVFVPPAEKGFQAAIEGYNGKWQAKVWGRFAHESLAALQAQSARYVVAHRRRTRQRRDSAPDRRGFPERWNLSLQHHPADYPGARLVYIRRTSQAGAVSLLGQGFVVDDTWAGRLVRCEVLLCEQVIRFYRLRRRAPAEQPLLHEAVYHLPRRGFRE